MALLQTLLLSLHVSLLLLCWSALAELDVTMPDRVEVYQGDSAEILCQYRFYETEEPSNMMFFLYAQTHPGSSSRTTIYYGENEQQEVSNKTEYTDRLVVTNNFEEKNVLFTVNNVNITDEREFTCSINGLDAGNSEAKTQLRVFVPPEALVIEGVTEGISVSNRLPSTIATCEARNGFPPPNITWYRNRELLKPKEGHVNVFSLFYQSSVGLYTAQSTLQYKVVKEDEDAQFSCEVTFFVPKATKKSESNSVNVTVHYPTTMAELWKELPQGLVKEGDTVELRCQGDGNPPPSFIINRLEGPSWYLDNSDDVLILPSVSRQDSGTYQCRPQNTNDETVKGEMLLAVHYLDPAVVVPKDSEVMLRGEELVATCNALSSLKTITVWYKNGIQVGEGNTLHLNDATYETSGEYVCEVTVLSLPALHTSASVHIIVQGGPELVGAEQDVQMVETGKMANLSCEAMGHPLPNIYWTVTGSENWHEVMNNASDHMTRSTVSVKVTSNIGAVCNATNDMGSEAKSFSIKSIPRVTSAASFSPAEGSGVIIVVIILSLLLLAILGSVLYFLHKKGKLPTGRYGKQEITKTSKDDIVIEMKNNGKNEESVHLKSHNGNTKGHNEQ